MNAVTTPIRVVHVITSLSVGGAEIALSRLVSAMDSRRFHNMVATLGEAKPLGESIRAAGVEVRPLGSSRRIEAPRALAGLVKLLRSARPDVVQTWMYHANAIGTIGARLAGAARLVWNVRTSDFIGRDASRELRVINAICAVATRTRLAPDAVVANSEAGRAEHTRLGYRTSRWEVIPNGFDLDRFRPDAAIRTQVRCELGVRPDVPLVGHVARLDPMKDHAGFLNAMALLRAGVPSVCCALAGRGVEAGSAIARAADRLGLAGCARFLGERSDVPRLLTAFDVLVSSSAYGEGFSNAIGEAMACGVPCVVTDVGSSAAIVGATGLVVPPGDAPALAAAVRRLLEMSPERRHELGCAARERVQERFALYLVADRYQALYAELAAR